MKSLISQLQSRIAKRRSAIDFHWELWDIYKDVDDGLDDYSDKIIANKLGIEQKLDKQILRELYDNQNEVKELEGMCLSCLSVATELAEENRKLKL